MAFQVAQKVLAEVYRLHHIPLPPITLETLIQRGPRVTSELISKIQQDPETLQKWKKENESIIVKSAQALHREIPIRLARRIVDLENLPENLPETSSIQKLRTSLLSSFEQMINSPLPKDLASEREFVQMQLRIREEHKGMHGTMAEALQQLSLQTKEPQGLSTILDDFYTSRIGIRMILDQHIAAQEPKAGFTGIIADECSPLQIAMEVIEKVTPLWKQKNTKVLPEFQIHGTTHAKYRYIPQHIEIILSEVIKNAMRNSLQISSPSTLPPPINVLVSGGAHGVCIKVSDLGGGTTREEANQLFGYYGYRSSSTEKKNQGYDPVSAALDTRGAKDTDSFGLRIASLYARYFGGELNLMPMEGHGMDAYIYMNCLTEKSNVKGTRNHEN